MVQRLEFQDQTQAVFFEGEKHLFNFISLLQTVEGWHKECQEAIEDPNRKKENLFAIFWLQDKSRTNLPKDERTRPLSQTFSVETTVNFVELDQVLLHS
jgi:hypothetical protein